MTFKKKIAYLIIGSLFILLLQVFFKGLVDPVSAQDGQLPSLGIKYLLTVDYPLGKKGDYLQWVKSVSKTLQEPEELKRIASYDNYFGVSPNRFIELEFENMEMASKYFERQGVRKVMEDLPNHGKNGQVYVMVLRGDYSKN